MTASQVRSVDRLAVRLATLGLAGLITFFIIMLVLQGLRTEVDPVRHTLSEYALGPYGVFMTGGFLLLGGSSAAVLGALLRLRAAGHGRWIWFAVWSVGVAVLSVVPTDPNGIPVTLAGYLHGTLALLALLSLTIGAILFSRWWQRLDVLRPFASLSGRFAVLLAVTLVLFVVSPPTYKGLTERLVVGADLAWLIWVAWGARSVALQQDFLRRPQHFQ